MSRRYRLAARMLDDFDRYCRGRLEAAALRARIERQRTPETAAMRVGRTVHALFERGARAGTTLALDGLTPLSDAGPGAPLRLWAPAAVEVPGLSRGDAVEVRAVRSDLHPRVQLAGVADVLTAGGLIREYKTARRWGGFEAYLDAWQWRVYLCLFPEAAAVDYVQVVVEPPRPSPGAGEPPGAWRVTSTATVRCTRYRGLLADVRAQIDRLVDALDAWVEAGHLDPSRCAWRPETLDGLAAWWAGRPPRRGRPA